PLCSHTLLSFPTRRSSDLLHGSGKRLPRHHLDVLGPVHPDPLGEIPHRVRVDRAHLGRHRGERIEEPETVRDIRALVADIPSRGDRKSTRLNSSHVKISYA